MRVAARRGRAVDGTEPEKIVQHRAFAFAHAVFRHAGQARRHVPLAARIRQRLEEEPTSLPEDPFIELLDEFKKADEAKRVLEVAVEWGRYGEVYEYDFRTGRLKLPDQDAE